MSGTVSISVSNGANRKLCGQNISKKIFQIIWNKHLCSDENKNLDRPETPVAPSTNMD